MSCVCCSQNLVRGRGLFCRSIMKSQMASPSFTNIYAALVAVLNTKFPEIGELLLTRVVLQFRRAYKRNDKPICIAASKFIAHLVSQQVRLQRCLRSGRCRGPLRAYLQRSNLVTGCRKFGCCVVKLRIVA